MARCKLKRQSASKNRQGRAKTVECEQQKMTYLFCGNRLKKKAKKRSSIDIVETVNTC